MVLELERIDSAAVPSPQTAPAAPAPHNGSEALGAELQRIPSVAPWMQFVAHDESLSDEMNAQLAAHVSAHVTAELSRILARLKRQQRVREAEGVLSPRAARALLESRLMVEAKRAVNLERVVANTRAAMETAQLMAEQANRARDTPVRGAAALDSEAGADMAAARAWRRGSVAVAAMGRASASPHRKGAGARGQSGRAGAKAISTAAQDESEHEIDHDSVFATEDTAEAARLSESSSLLCVRFPPRDPRTLSEALAEDAEKRAAENEAERRREGGACSVDSNEVTGFWRRAVADSAVFEDASAWPVPRRESRPTERVRYIMSTRLGALPPTKRILDEYPIPKEILDALERHRHVHVDAFSLETSFDPIRVSSSSSDSHSHCITTEGSAASESVGPSALGWECYVRRSVPLERPPVSFVLASLSVARERPVPPPSDVFHQHVLAAATSEAAMLAEVRQLFDHAHDAYRAFRATLHRNLDVSFLVDLAFRSSLNSASLFLDDAADDSQQVVPTDAAVQIPPLLRQRAAAVDARASGSKWRAASKGAARMSHRRGAIALSVKSEAASVLQRNEMVNKLTTFSALEVRLMELWHRHDPDSEGPAQATETGGGGAAGGGSGGAENPAPGPPLDPVAMPPALSARFEAVWRELQMPAEERLDLAIKYSTLAGSARLADAVALWELGATLVREREELLSLVRAAAAAGSAPRSSAVVATETAMLQELTASSLALKEALVLAYVHVGDFITLGGNFYLARMEYEAAELRELVLQGIDTAKRRPAEDAALSDGTRIGAQLLGRRGASD